MKDRVESIRPSFAEMEAVAKTKRPLPERLRDATEYAEHEGYVAPLIAAAEEAADTIEHLLDENTRALTLIDTLMAAVEAVKKADPQREARHRVSMLVNDWTAIATAQLGGGKAPDGRRQAGRRMHQKFSKDVHTQEEPNDPV